MVPDALHTRKFTFSCSSCEFHCQSDQPMTKT